MPTPPKHVSDISPSTEGLSMEESHEIWRRLRRKLIATTGHKELRSWDYGDRAANEVARAMETYGREVPHDFLCPGKGPLILGWFTGGGFHAHIVPRLEMPLDLREYKEDRVIVTPRQTMAWIKFEWDDDEVPTAYFLELVNLPGEE